MEWKQNNSFDKPCNKTNSKHCDPLGEDSLLSKCSFLIRLNWNVTNPDISYFLDSKSHFSHIFKFSEVGMRLTFGGLRITAEKLYYIAKAQGKS
jgi:hypothetical protein